MNVQSSAIKSNLTQDHNRTEAIWTVMHIFTHILRRTNRTLTTVIIYKKNASCTSYIIQFEAEVA